MCSSTDSTVDDITAYDQAELSDAEDERQLEFEDGTDQSNGTADQQQLKFLCEKMAKMELEKKLLQVQLGQQKLMAKHDVLQAKVAKMEQKQQKNEGTKANVWDNDQIKQLLSAQKALLARIDELERQIKQQEEEKKDGIETFDDDQFKAFSKLISKLEWQLKQQQDEKEKGASADDWRKTQQQQMANFGLQLKNAEQKIDQLLQQQNDQQTTALCAKIDQLEMKQTECLTKLKTIYENLATPPNCWDANARHGDLEIIGPKCTIVYYKGNGRGSRSLFAEHSILNSDSGIFYFEMRVENVKRYLGIGLATKAMALVGVVGWPLDSCAYYSDGKNGTFWINGSSTSGKTPSFSAGDVVGCGINLTNCQIIFTKNGQRLDTTDLSISSPIDSLFPCVTLYDSGDKIETNFGPNFKFDIATLKE